MFLMTIQSCDLRLCHCRILKLFFLGYPSHSFILFLQCKQQNTLDSALLIHFLYTYMWSLDKELAICHWGRAAE